MMNLQKITLQQASLEEIYHHVVIALEKQLLLQLQSMKGSRKTHAFDMAIPDLAQSNDALLIQVDPGMTPMCTFVPRQLNREQMTSFFPKSWITNILGRKGTMQAKRKNPLEGKNGNFLEESSSKEELQKYVLYVEDHVTL